MVFRGNIVTGIIGNTFSDQGMLFGTFLMKNIFIKISAPILNHVFAQFRWNFHAFFLTNLMLLCGYGMIVQTKPMEIIGFFDEIMQKIWFKMRVGKLMKIFFMRNVSNNIPWPLKVSLVISETIFPRKTIKFSWFFTFADYCRASYRKCMHCSIHLQKRAVFARARSRK